jgi:hypothetical protein
MQVNGTTSPGEVAFRKSHALKNNESAWHHRRLAMSILKPYAETMNRMRVSPGIINNRRDGGFATIPRHIDAIGHIVIGSFA